MVSSWIFSTDKEENDDDAFWRNLLTSSSAVVRAFRSSAEADAEEGSDVGGDDESSWAEFCNSKLSTDEEDNERSFKVSSSCSALSSSYWGRPSAHDAISFVCCVF